MPTAVGVTLRGMAATLIALTCGCVTGKPPVVAAVPRAPQPAGSSAPVTTPEPPISYPQTVVRLPRPQPIPPDSITEPPVEEPPVVRPSSRGRMPAVAPTAVPPTREAPAVEVRAPGTLRPAGPVPEATPALTRTDENSVSGVQIEPRIQAVREMLGRLGGGKRTADLNVSIARVQSLLTLAKRALDRHDLRQADSLTERAEVIARDLLRAR